MIETFFILHIVYNKIGSLVVSFLNSIFLHHVKIWRMTRELKNFKKNEKMNLPNINIEKINLFQRNYLTCHDKQKNSLGKIKLFQFE
ncbi:hypothetical protein BpHYR1_015379 [Brachionus plicatilis]|uniref:Uncharacterized protein n=1 Tax=Brachionus plicatilis TaxID=10195 RepID=A0A3M7PEP8_BRAPC|nr:hypothetical protein BpHYR1_015379 [Brachionus plicatilis]